MATITTNTFLDGGTAVAAGEAWTLNGGNLTIRTDSRWHANKPAGTTGSVGAITGSATLGGGVLIDARNVREVTFNSGSGVVPAIGTSITQGGVSGYLLGVWPDLASAPLNPAAAMPATGFIKFREVTGGNFAAGGLTGISATSDGADVPSWIEFVQEQAIANIINRLNFFRTRGTWYTLPQTTSGAVNQTIQIPTNGGGVGTEVPAIWIETGVGTGIYESFPCIRSAIFNNTNLGTDQRSKFCQAIGNGQVRIGFDGANNTGFVPPVGCRIQIPNILGRQTTSANRALNLIPSATLATRPDYTTTSNGPIDFEFFMSDSYFLFASPNNVFLKNCATFDILSTSNEAQPCEIDNLVVSPYNAAGSISLTLLNNPNGGFIRNSKFFRASADSNGHSATITVCSGYDFENTHHGVITFARSTGRSLLASQITNCTFTDFFQYNAGTTLTTCNNITMTGFDHNDRFVGNTNGTTGISCLTTTASSVGITLDGITFGQKGVVTAFCNPFLALVNCATSSNVLIRNGGTITNKLRVENATNAPQYIFQDAGTNDGIRVQRIYLDFSRTADYIGLNTSKNITLESCQGTLGTTTGDVDSNNTLKKGGRRAASITTLSPACYGSHFFDEFFSDTIGALTFTGNENTPQTASTISLTLTGSTGGFTAGGQCSLPNVGDILIITSPYFVLGHTAFQNVAPTLLGTLTGNFLYEYDLDTGAGFDNVYQTLNATNLSAETISSTGFRLRLRISTVTANTTNAHSYVHVPTNSTFAAQRDNLYNLDTAIVNLNGLIAGSRVQLFDTTNTVELFNDIVPGTTLTLAVPFTTSFNMRTRAMFATAATARIFYEQTDNITAMGITKTINQELDSVYVANGVDGFTVSGIDIVDSTFLVEIDSTTLPIPNIYAYSVAWLFSEEGIRDEGQYIEALDQANYLVSEFSIKNVSMPSVPLTLTNGWIRDAITNTTTAIIDNTGGSIFSNPDLVIPFASGSGLSPAQDATLSKIDTLTENVGGLRYTAKALETAGGSSLTVGAIADAVWDEAITAHLTAGSTGAVLNAASAPSASTVASAVRTELTTELGRIDASVSSRLATAGYTAPANADITSIKAKTDILVNTDLTGIATSTNVTSAQTAIIAEVNANETKIDIIDSQVDLIKTKVDTLNNPDLTPIAKTAELVTINDNVKLASLGIPASDDI